MGRAAQHHNLRGDIVANSTAQVSVTTTAGLLVTAPSGGGPASSSYTFQNAGATDCYLGLSGVTSSNGFILKAGAAFSCELAAGDKLYAITAAGSTTVHVFSEVPS